MPAEELRPCPFCGNEDPELMDSDNGYFVVCQEPTACCLTAEHATISLAIEAWNRRRRHETKND